MARHRMTSSCALGIAAALFASAAARGAIPAERAAAALPGWTVRYASERPEYQPGFSLGKASRVVLRRDVPVRFGREPQQRAERVADDSAPPSMLLHDHVELFIVPGSGEPIGSLPNDSGEAARDRIPWLSLEQQSMPVATDLGTDGDARFYARGPFEAMRRLKVALRTTGGEGAIDFAIRAHNEAAARRGRDGERSDPTRNDAADALRAAGDAALRKLAAEVDAGRFAVDYVRVVASIPGEASSALLARWRRSGDRELAQTAARALVYSEPPRADAKADILDVLATEPSAAREAARLVERLGWTEAVPTLASLRESCGPSDYDAIFRAHRALTGQPIPDEIENAFKTLHFTGDVPPAGVVAAKDALLHHADAEAAAVVAARLMNWTTKGDTHGARAIGRAILDALPPAATAEVRRAMARD